MSLVAVIPDPIATFLALALARYAAEGDTPEKLRSRRNVDDVPPYGLLQEAGGQRARNAPVVNPARVSVRIYDTDDGAAARRYRRLSALLHGFGPVIVELDEADGGSVGVWRVFDETGVQAPVQEPDTGWWVAGGVFDLFMADRSVGA